MLLSSTSSRTDPDDDVVDVKSFTALDVVEINMLLSLIVIIVVVSSRTDLYDDVVDVTSYSALDVVEIVVIVVVVVLVDARRSCNKYVVVPLVVSIASCPVLRPEAFEALLAKAPKHARRMMCEVDMRGAAVTD